MSINWKDPEEKRAYDRAYKELQRQENPEAQREATRRYKQKNPYVLMNPAVKRRHYVEAAKNRWAARAAAKRMLTEDDKARMADLLKVSEFIDSQKAKPCRDCGHDYPPWVMDFDHRDPSTKKNSVSKCRNIRAAVAEIGKCDLVCSNCHREREHERREFFNVCKGLKIPN